MRSLPDDRLFIENKYHRTDLPFDPFAHRKAYQGWEYNNGTGLTDDELLNGLNKLWQETQNLPHPVAYAKAVQYVLENTQIDVNEHDWFVGFRSISRLVASVFKTRWAEEVFCSNDESLSTAKQEIDELFKAGVSRIDLDFEHNVPHFDALIELGFPGIRDRVEKYRKMHENQGTLTPQMAAHFEGMVIEYSAIIQLLDRLYQFALGQSHKKASAIAQCLKNLRDGAPTNVFEVLQLIYIFCIISDHIDSFQVVSLGNGLDSTLYKYYKHDLESGKFTREEIREFLGYFMLQWSSIGNYWGQAFYIGGTNPDGSTKYNQLSQDILDVYDDLCIYNPKIQVKINASTPDSILNKILDMIRRGKNSFVFCCEPGMMKAVMAYGATYEEALNLDIRGCYEVGVKGKELVTAHDAINAAKAIEYVFSNGFDETIQKQIGLQTGDLDHFSSFPEFYTAVLVQLKHLLEIPIRICNIIEPHLSYVCPSILHSATMEESLRRGKDAHQDGVEHNNTSLGIIGFASLVDSILAIKQLVYVEKRVTLEYFKRALDADWNGYEELRHAVLRCPHKFGNNDKEADSYAAAISGIISTTINNRPNVRGGVYKTMFHSALCFLWFGAGTAATPDGRKAGTELSKNASPVPGMDTKGVTALLQSVVKLNPASHLESFCVDIMLHPSSITGDNGLMIMRTLLDYYLHHSGMSLQINVFDAKCLKDAQKNPEKYKNLQVRVCGWNVLWNNLSRQEQDAYIERAENIE